MTTKKILSVLLSVVMVLTMCAVMGVSAFAEEPSVIGTGECGAQGNNLIWTLTDDGVLTISGTGAMADYGSYPNLDEDGNYIYDDNGNPFIEGDDAPWTNVANQAEADLLAALGYETVEEAEEAINNGTFDWDAYFNFVVAMEANASAAGHKVVIEEGVTALGANAFRDWNVTEVTLPSSLKEIGYYAFKGNFFKTVTLPEGLEYIGEYAFNGCNELESIVIPASVTHMDSYSVGGNRLASVTVLNPELDIYDLGYIQVLGSGSGSFPFASVEDYEFFGEVWNLVTLFRAAKYDYAAQLQAVENYYAQLVADGQMTQEQADANLNNYRSQMMLQFKFELLDASIEDCDAAAAVICDKLNALLGTELDEEDLVGVYDMPLNGEDSEETYKDARLAPAADAVLTQKLGHGYAELRDADVRTYSIAHYCNNPDSGHTPAPWVQLTGCCGSAFETYVKDVFPFTELHDTVAHEAKAPTCVDIGWDAYETCSRCDYTTYAEKPATGVHMWGEWTVTTPATATADGVKTRECGVCHETETDVIPATDAPSNPDTPDTPDNPGQSDSGKCVCGETHTGFFGKLLTFFHKIIYFFKNLFNR